MTYQSKKSARCLLSPRYGAKAFRCGSVELGGRRAQMWLSGAGWIKSSVYSVPLCKKIIFGDGFNAENRAKIKWDFFFSF